MAECAIPACYASADEPTLRDRIWLEQEWDGARLLARDHPGGALLIIDEIQKVMNWSDTVKLLWDADTHAGTTLKVMLLGSSPLFHRSGRSGTLAFVPP